MEQASSLSLGYTGTDASSTEVEIVVVGLCFPSLNLLCDRTMHIQVSPLNGCNKTQLMLSDRNQEKYKEILK
ncbi:MAG: hypothetical protein F6K41_20800 [Symploca sp. SIO3E6]|nr:hypothetical protein [Caldora sp. SIO3E6]